VRHLNFSLGVLMWNQSLFILPLSRFPGLHKLMVNEVPGNLAFRAMAANKPGDQEDHPKQNDDANEQYGKEN